MPAITAVQNNGESALATIDANKNLAIFRILSSQEPHAAAQTIASSLQRQSLAGSWSI